MKEIHILYALDKIEVFRSMMVQTRWFKKGVNVPPNGEISWSGESTILSK